MKLSHKYNLAGMWYHLTKDLPLAYLDTALSIETGLRFRTLTKAVAELYLFWNFGKLSIFVTQVLTEKKTTKPRLRKGSDFPILCIIVCIVSQEHVAYQDQ